MDLRGVGVLGPQMSSPAWDTQPGGLNIRRHVLQSGDWTSQPACCQASLSSWLGDSLLLTLSPLCPRSWVSSRKDTALLDDAPPPPRPHPASLPRSIHSCVEAGATDEPTGAAGLGDPGQEAASRAAPATVDTRVHSPSFRHSVSSRVYFPGSWGGVEDTRLTACQGV